MGAVVYNGRAHPFLTKLVFIAVETATQYLFHGITGYVHVRPKLRTLLCSQDINLIRDFSSRDFVATLRNHWQS
jgi:hypothetical protein